MSNAGVRLILRLILISYYLIVHLQQGGGGAKGPEDFAVFRRSRSFGKHNLFSNFESTCNAHSLHEFFIEHSVNRKTDVGMCSLLSFLLVHAYLFN